MPVNFVLNQIRHIVVFMKNISAKTAILSINSGVQASKLGDLSDSFFVISSQVSKLIEDVSNITETLEKVLYDIDAIFKDFYMQKDTIVSNFSKLIEYISVTEYDIKNIALDISLQNEYSSNLMKNIDDLKDLNSDIMSILSEDRENIESVDNKINTLLDNFKEFNTNYSNRENSLHSILNDINKLFAISDEFKSLSEDLTKDVANINDINSTIKSKTISYRYKG